MQPGRGGKYQDLVATVVTVAVHVLVGVFLLLNLNFTGAPHSERAEVEAIPARVVDEVAIREQQQRLAAEERRRQREETERLARLAQAEREAEERR
ncbi:MAG: hypothetical protein RKO24_03805, partial [Candidatus Competibacter sp.]|nr:hypothetical protein [Candidatus Competibacter sp.]